jgi:hypothetical protein
VSLVPTEEETPPKRGLEIVVWCQGYALLIKLAHTNRYVFSIASSALFL